MSSVDTDGYMLKMQYMDEKEPTRVWPPHVVCLCIEMYDYLYTRAISPHIILRMAMNASIPIRPRGGD